MLMLLIQDLVEASLPTSGSSTDAQVANLCPEALPDLSREQNVRSRAQVRLVEYAHLVLHLPVGDDQVDIHVLPLAKGTI
jgi:hypothetical protein